jgi:hypothetical protein
MVLEKMHRVGHYALAEVGYVNSFETPCASRSFSEAYFLVLYPVRFLTGDIAIRHLLALCTGLPSGLATGGTCLCAVDY